METAATGQTPEKTHYQRPGWVTRRAVVPAMNGLMHLGVSAWGSRILEHKGRKSGVAHRTPVNLLTVDGQEYLVSPRGESEWVRNVRADGGRLVLILGRRRQERLAVEVPQAERATVLRAYLTRWKFEVGQFFDGVGPDSTDDELIVIAERHPVFALR